jgi:hypothetical protein
MISSYQNLFFFLPNFVATPLHLLIITGAPSLINPAFFSPKAVHSCWKESSLQKKKSSASAFPFTGASSKISTTNWKPTLTPWIKSTSYAIFVKSVLPSIVVEYVTKSSHLSLRWLCTRISSAKLFTLSSAVFTERLMVSKSWSVYFCCLHCTFLLILVICKWSDFLAIICERTKLAWTIDSFDLVGTVHIFICRCRLHFSSSLPEHQTYLMYSFVMTAHILFFWTNIHLQMRKTISSHNTLNND